MEEDEHRVDNDNENVEKEEEKSLHEENGVEDEEERKEAEEENEPAPKSPSPKPASPPPPPTGMVLDSDFDAMDPLDALSKVREQFEANKYMLDNGDFHSFPERCDLTATSERATKAFSHVHQRILALQTKLREAMEAVLSFNKSLDRKIKEDSLDSWIVKDKVKHSEIAEEVKIQKVKMKQEGAQHHARLAEAMQEFHRLAESASEMLEISADMETEVVAAEEAVLVGRINYEEALKAEEARREKEEEERKKAEEKRRKLEAEEAKRRAEEEAQRKEEERIKGTPEEQELRRRREEEQRLERERRDPRNWPKLVFHDAEEHIVCVVRTIASENLKMEDLRIAPVDFNESIFKLSANDEIVSSRMVNLEKAGMETEFQFEEPWAVAIPFTAQRNPAREPVLMGLQPDGSWQRMPSQEVQFEDLQGTKFVETRISDPYCTLIAMLTIKTDRHQVGKKGGKVNSSLDSRISINFPPGAIHVTLNTTMQVQPVESHFFSELKAKQKDALSHLVTCSHIVSFGIVKKRVSKPVTVAIPVPLDPAKKNRPATAVEKGKSDSSMAARPSTAYHRSDNNDDGDEEIHVIFKKPSLDKWREMKDVEIVTQKNKDVVTFDIQLVESMRFMAMRTHENTSEESLAKMAQLIDDGLNIRNVCFVLRQKVEDQTDVLIQVVPAHKAGRALKNLHEEGFDDEGPPPSKEFVVKERQTFEITFRGNVRVEDQEVPLHLMYNSQLKNRISFTVCEEDKFAQKSIECYRGFAQVFSNMITRKLVQREEAGQRKTTYEEKEERVKLCELLINIPKTITDTPRPINRAKFCFKANDCIDEEFLRQLASCLNNEWKSLAEELGLSHTRIQAIQRNHAHSSTEDIIMDMLLTWVRKMATSISKAKPLANALDRCNRGDLADEIREKQREFDRLKS